MKCYFCSHNIEREADWQIHFHCDICEKKCWPLRVATTYTYSKGLVYAHIHYDCLSTKIVYHVRLHPGANRTELEYYHVTAEVAELGPMVDDIKLLCVLPGFPIHPENAIEKINLCRVFV